MVGRFLDFVRTRKIVERTRGKFNAESAESLRGETRGRKRLA
jgi:hypothetical protein